MGTERRGRLTRTVRRLPTPAIRLLILASLLLAGCGRGSGGVVPDAPPPAAQDTAVAAEETAAGSGGAPTRVPPEPTTPPARATGDVPASAFDPSAIGLDLRPFAGELNQPLFVTHAGDGSGRVFAVEQGGTIRTIPDGDLFLDIRDRVGANASEQGLLGLAFHPRFRENGLFFVNYTDRDGNTVVARYGATPDRAAGDPATERVVLRQEQPAANHNGGMLAFGPDGHLYIGLGDGGGAGDTYGNGQNRNTFLGKILRIAPAVGGDPDEPAYTVPEDNPWLGREGARPEIWATGLRNPWRFSFDRETGELYIADVGQNAYEWVLHQPEGDRGGRNYGWPITEGNHCYDAETCDRTGITPPVAEYGHDLGQSITGGYVYRGREFPRLRGAYVLGDFSSGRVWTLHRAAGDRWALTEILDTDHGISTFGEDEAGELYMADHSGGAVYRVAARAR